MSSALSCSKSARDNSRALGITPAVRRLFWLAGAAHVALGLVQVFVPGPFYEELATFGARNDHYVRDLGTFYVALGAAFFVAAGRPSWRAPVLFVALVEYGLHTANHVYDIGRGEGDWVGPVNAVLVGAGFVALLLVAYALSRRQ